MFHFNKFSIFSVLLLANPLFSDALFISTLLEALICFFGYPVRKVHLELSITEDHSFHKIPLSYIQC